MTEDNAVTQEVALTQALASDHLLQIAQVAEQRVAAIKRIKELALSVTNQRDWVDFGGKPYLQVSGSEKVARLFGISWCMLEDAECELHDDGHYSYIFHGKFSMGAVEIEAIGTRSSRDDFFSKVTRWRNENGKNVSYKEDKPMSEIDRNDVRKAAWTNCIGNGVTRLLGIRNLTWEELRAAKIAQQDTSKVEFQKKAGAAPTGSSPTGVSESGRPPVVTDAPAPKGDLYGK